MPQISDKLNQISPPAFVSRTYDMVDDPSVDAIVSWSETLLIVIGLSMHINFLRDQKHLLGTIRKEKHVNLVQQQNENNRRIAGVNKKQRLPNLEDSHFTTDFDGQIIEYQPLLNEAAQAMLMQLNFASPSHRLDVDSISVNYIPSPASTQLYNGGTCVTLSEVAPTSGHSLLSVSSGYSEKDLSAAISEIQSSGVVADAFTITTSPLPDTSILDALEEELGLPHMQDMGLENKGIEILGADFMGHGH
ncbi:hypothetical protein MKX01_007622 [Papaver californicum]|nr:hypothetical protein MKX01_007622 [Papaver californicum]